VPLDQVSNAAPPVDPVVHPETEPFWHGIAVGELRVQRCTRCGTHRFPFGPVCFRCLSFDYTWEPLGGNGTVAVAAVVRRATGDKAWEPYVPFISGLVDLEHGLRLPGRILCTCGAATRRGTEVHAVVLTAPGRSDVHGFMHSCIPSPSDGHDLRQGNVRP